MPAEATTMEWRFSTLAEKSVIVNEVEDALAHALREGNKEHLVIDMSHGVRMAVEEALVNHLKHGHQLDESKVVQASLVIDHETLVMDSQDQGPGFDIEDVPDPTAPENIERNCGRGVMLMRFYTEKWGGSLEVLEHGTRMRMTFLLRDPPAKE